MMDRARAGTERMMHHQARPCSKWKLIESRLVDTECPPTVPPRRLCKVRQQPSSPRNRPLRVVNLCRDSSTIR